MCIRDSALGVAAQSAAARSAITMSYIWVETIGFGVCALMILFFTVEKSLPKARQSLSLIHIYCGEF